MFMLYAFKNYDRHDIMDELSIEITDRAHVHVDYRLPCLQVGDK